MSVTQPVTSPGLSHGTIALPEITRVPLVDLLDRVLAKGVVVSGELTLSIAEVDLVHLSLRALLSSVRPDLFDREAPVDPSVRTAPR